jgi:hypothetical protein
VLQAGVQSPSAVPRDDHDVARHVGRTHRSAL